MGTFGYGDSAIIVAMVLLYIAFTAWLTLRDPDVDMSLSCMVRVTALDAMPAPLGEGARVVVQAKPSYWTQRGSLSMDVRQIRPVGVGRTSRGPIGVEGLTITAGR